MNEFLYNKAKEKDPSLTPEAFEQKREEALARADASLKSQEGKMAVGSMVMEASAEEAEEIAKDME